MALYEPLWEMVYNEKGKVLKMMFWEKISWRTHDQLAKKK